MRIWSETYSLPLFLNLIIIFFFEHSQCKNATKQNQRKMWIQKKIKKKPSSRNSWKYQSLLFYSVEITDGINIYRSVVYFLPFDAFVRGFVARFSSLLKTTIACVARFFHFSYFFSLYVSVYYFFRSFLSLNSVY